MPMREDSTEAFTSLRLAWISCCIVWCSMACRCVVWLTRSACSSRRVMISASSCSATRATPSLMRVATPSSAAAVFASHSTAAAVSAATFSVASRITSARSASCFACTSPRCALSDARSALRPACRALKRSSMTARSLRTTEGSSSTACMRASQSLTVASSRCTTSWVISRTSSRRAAVLSASSERSASISLHSSRCCCICSSRRMTRADSSLCTAEARSSMLACIFPSRSSTISQCAWKALDCASCASVIMPRTWFSNPDMSTRGAAAPDSAAVVATGPGAAPACVRGGGLAAWDGGVAGVEPAGFDAADV
mmetsp:Transcript_40408/g.124812  ORF Transcript_40408/g.124812 Transcript_40408/m.124812 type:complete len:312 (+) Transcript_40408:587-1522(+)